MFKTFFGKVWSTIKAAPKALVKTGKSIASMVVGIGYFIVWCPIACMKFYVSIFKSFGDAVFSKISSLFKKLKSFKVSSADTAAEAV